MTIHQTTGHRLLTPTNLLRLVSLTPGSGTLALAAYEVSAWSLYAFRNESSFRWGMIWFQFVSLLRFYPASQGARLVLPLRPADPELARGS